MSHDTHIDTSGSKANTKVSFSSSFWLVVILVFLFIGALNFIQVSSHGEEGEHATEQKHEGAKEGEMTEHHAPAEPAEHHAESAPAEPAAEHK